MVGLPDAALVVVVGRPTFEVHALPSRDLLPFVAAEARERYGPDVALELHWQSHHPRPSAW